MAFASPSLALIAIVIVFPIAYSFWLSFRNFDLAVGPDSEFVVGANYFEALFGDTASSTPSGTPRSSSGRR